MKTILEIILVWLGLIAVVAFAGLTFDFIKDIIIIYKEDKRNGRI
jgi:hypothetical protein